LSDIAVREAQIMVDALPLEAKPESSWYEFRVASFFDLDEDDKFDIIYDYTFLCALNPSVVISYDI